MDDSQSALQSHLDWPGQWQVDEWGIIAIGNYRHTCGTVGHFAKDCTKGKGKGKNVKGLDKGNGKGFDKGSDKGKGKSFDKGKGKVSGRYQGCGYQGACHYCGDGGAQACRVLEVLEGPSESDLRRGRAGGGDYRAGGVPVVLDGGPGGRGCTPTRCFLVHAEEFDKSETCPVDEIWTSRTRIPCSSWPWRHGCMLQSFQGFG